MQSRQTNREQYFQELAITSRNYFLPYISRFYDLKPGLRVLEIGCGDGGNLLPFSELGCYVLGVDMAEVRINDAKRFFCERKATGKFICSDIFKLNNLHNSFDIILCHDVIEHIYDKALFIKNTKLYLKDDGILFISFPAWQMPFGGHQQICKSKILSHLPFFHLLPTNIYLKILKTFKEDEHCVNELKSIKETKCPIELFEKNIEGVYKILNRTLFFINPHYKVKFGLQPRILPNFIGRIMYFRNFFTTSTFYILKK